MATRVTLNSSAQPQPYWYQSPPNTTVTMVAARSCLVSVYWVKDWMVSDFSYLGYYTIYLKCSFGLLSLLALLFVRLSPSPHLATYCFFLFFYPTLFLTPLVFVVFWIINEPDKSLQAYVTMCSTVKLWNEQSTQTVSNDWFSYKLWAGAIAQTRRLR